MDDNRTVVVVTKATMVRLEKRDHTVFAARFTKLGITAYGHTKSEAVSNLKLLFNRFIHIHRDAGLLKARLEKAGVEWSWADEYTGKYEDTNQPEPADQEFPSANVPDSPGGTTALFAAAA